MSPKLNNNSNNLSYTNIVMPTSNNSDNENNQQTDNSSNTSQDIDFPDNEFNTIDLIPERLKNELLEKGLLIVNVPQDGNCMFHAIASHLPGVSYYNLRKSIVWLSLIHI